MKRILFILGLTLFFGCQQNKAIDGRYVSDDFCFVYGLEVNSIDKEVRLFIVDELSSEMSNEQYQLKKTWSDFRFGTLLKNETGDMGIYGIDSDPQLYDKPAFIPVEFQENEIKLPCKFIYDTFLGASLAFHKQFCVQDKITFIRTESFN